MSYRTRLGSVQALEERLFHHLPEIARCLPAARWTEFKHEAIDPDSSFVWFEDGLEEADLAFLKTHDRLDAFVPLDLTDRRNPMRMLDEVKARLARRSSEPTSPPQDTAAGDTPVRAGRRLIFLDFDGVLHTDGGELFARLALFEGYLEQMPDAQVVISSAWRQEHDLEWLRTLFSAPLRDRIVGVSPTLDEGYDQGGRQREIEAFLRAADLQDGAISWIALDDAAFYFDENCPHLLLVPADRAFGDTEGHALLDWYAAVASTAPAAAAIV